MVVTRYGHRVPTARIEVVEAAHPVPDAAGRAATERMLNLVQGLSSDGTKDNAGAPLLPDTLARARANGLHAPACPANNDGYSFFAALDDLVVTGPTMTNVNDFRALLIR
jgi:glycerate-2-kinase